MSALFWNLPESVTTLNSPQGNHRFPQNAVTVFEGAMPWLLVNSAFLVFAAAFPGSGRVVAARPGLRSSWACSRGQALGVQARVIIDRGFPSGV